MRLRFFNAARLAEDLAAGAVTPRQQAGYVAITFVAWLLPYYFYVWVYPAVMDGQFATGLYWMEFAMLVVVNIAGPFYCLRQCRVDPARHFLVDFTCLYAPAAVIVLAASWAVFHFTAMWLMPRALAGMDDRGFANFLGLRIHDVLRYLTVIGQIVLIYAAVGHFMRRAAELRA